MKRLLWSGVVCLFVAAAMTLCGGQDGSANPGIRKQFVGAWRLARLEQPGVDGKLHNTDSTGLLVFKPLLVRSSIRKAGTRHRMAPIRLTSAVTPSLFMLRAHWCEILSAKTCRAHSSFRGNSSL